MLTLLRVHVAIGCRAGLGAIDGPFTLLEAAGLGARDLPVLDPALDAVLLVVLALVDVVHRLGGGGAADEQTARQHGVRYGAKS